MNGSGSYGLQSGHGWWGNGYNNGNYYSACAGYYSGFYASGNGPYSYPFNNYLPSKGYYYYGYPSAAYIYPSGYAPPYNYGYRPTYSPPVAATGIRSSAYYDAAAAAARTSAYYDPAAPSNVPSASIGSTAAGSDSVRIDVTVPDPDAEIIVQGYQVKSKGKTRSFVSPAVEPGQSFAYTITMQRAVDGRTVDETRTIDVRAGAKVAIDFTKPPAEPVPVPKSQPPSNYVP
jgi:uncharacterized protein (TIGR03000 family)